MLDLPSKEMQWAITRHTTGDARVIHIILKPTPGWETIPLSPLREVGKPYWLELLIFLLRYYSISAKAYQFTVAHSHITDVLLNLYT